MDKEEKARLNAVEQVEIVLEKFSDDFRTIEEFSPLLDVFNRTSKELHDALGVQERIGSGASKTALSDRDVMADTIVTYTLRAKVKAKAANDIDLYDALNKPKTYYTSGAKTVSVERANEVVKVLKANLGILTNIKPEDIDAINETITAYDETKNEAVENIKVRKATATDVIPELFDENSDAIDDMFDLTVSYFSKTKVEIVDAFALAKQVVNTAIRHTGITFEILDAGNDKPIDGASITDVSTKNVYVTDENGDAHIEKHRSGTFHFMIEAKGKPSKDYVAIIKRGVENSFMIKI